MKVSRKIKWIVGVAAALLAVVGMVGYVLIKRVPGDYRPLTPTATENAEAVDTLRRTVVDFLGVTSGVGSYDPDLPPGAQVRRQAFLVKEDDLNRWIASLPVEALGALHSVGLSRPAVAIGEDRLTLYAHWAKMDAILGLDLEFAFDGDDAMEIRIRAAHIGGLALPDRFVESHKRRLIHRLRSQLQSMAAGGGERFGPLKLDEIGRAGVQVIQALGGRRVRLDVPKRYGHARVRGITLRDGQMILDIISLLPAAQAEGR